MKYICRENGNPNLPYRLAELPVFFSDLSCLDIIEATLDDTGKIKKFPGIMEDERWKRKHRIGQCYDVRFEASFYAMDDQKYLMLWLIQPSGWEWVDDDGFGFSGDSSIMLYSIIDNRGNLKKFELFSIDGVRYCHDYDQYL